MGCHNCAPKSKPVWTENKQTSFLAPTLHYSLNFVPQSACLNDLKREDLEYLYKKVLSPFQLKALPFSNARFLDANHTNDHKDNHDISFEGKFRDLQSELVASIQTWPLNTSDSIFVFINEGKNVKLKVFITGAEYTPYAHGLFEFDMTFEKYPNNPPKIRFVTTGNNQICFSPRLLKSGKVRLPILGTMFSREQEELWTPDTSISEVLFALHELVKTNNMCENEIELASLKADDEGRRRMNKASGNIVKYCTIKYAMLEYIRNPAPWLRNFVHSYFYLKKDIILKECRKWLLAAQTDDGLYEGMGALYNPELAEEFKDGKYFEKLKDIIKVLEKELSRIKIHIDPPILLTLSKEMDMERERERDTQSRESFDTNMSGEFE